MICGAQAQNMRVTRNDQIYVRSNRAGEHIVINLFRTYFSLQQIAEKEGRQKVLAGKLIKAS